MALWQITAAIVMLIVVVAVAVRLLSPRAKPTNQTDRQTDREWHLRSTSYHAVSIRCGRDACEAAKQLVGKCFLSKEAPPLPLPECTASNCHCQYAHHKDRREEEDRRSGLRSPFAMEGWDRRAGKGRRWSDKFPS